MVNFVLDFLLVLQYMTLLLLDFIPRQDFRKSVNYLVDEVIWSFFMSISYFKMVLPEVEANNPFGIMLPFTRKAKLE